MKTADVELPVPEVGKPTRSLGSLFSRSEGKKPKYKAGSHPSAGGEARDKTQVSQSIADVLKLLRADEATRIGVHGDKGFFDSFKGAADGIECIWLSNDFVVDQQLGAMPLTGDRLKDCQAVVVGGTDVATKYRLTLRGTLAHAPAVPVHWVADNWEFCGGTAAIPQEIEDVDALVFNHFEEFFGIKDPLQFRFEIISDHGIKRRYQVLGPSQSINLNLKEFAGERDGPVCLKVYVSHPSLTRGRHYRFRMCADVFWKDSFTIIHGSHQFFKNPNKEQPFRLIDSVVRGGHVVMTVPNYDLDMGSDDTIVIGSGADKKVQTRSRTRPVEVVHFERRERPSEGRDYFAASYKGYGTSFWYALEEGCFSKPGKLGSISGNHLCKVGVDDRDDAAFRADELRVVEQAVAAGFMIHPSFLPVMHGRSKLTFGFNYDASNPPFEHYWLRFYAADGEFVGEMRWRKGFSGPAFIEDVLEAWGSHERFRVAGVMVAPDHLKIGIAPQRFVTTADLVVRQLETGDQDATEFQPSWRNLGAVVPTLPHWLHPSIGVMGRTNVIGRVRCRGGFRTGVFVANASGNLKYDMTAEVEITA
ncbi:MAG TPA: hypothetical protein VE665_10770, partial [Hyphomicrobiaceae bacterium]|nr:hypothetical protein [Hyphomicrobiaceae bacterium]